MTESSFVRKNSALWRNLEGLLNAPNQSFGAIDARMNLYRIVSGHLSYARIHYPDSTLCEYLDGLTAQAHAAIYAHTAQRTRARLLTQILPRSLWENGRFILLSAAVLLLSVLVGYAVCLANPLNADAFLPEGYSGNYTMSNEDLEKGIWSGAVMSSYIMTNNIRVCILCFGLGVTCCVGTVYVLVYNGMMLGALAAVYAAHGNSLFFWSIILPHGVWELSAIFLSGAAGLCIGWRIIRPGPHRRSDALAAAARSALGIMGLVVVMLCVAGVIEGFYTPLSIDPAAKLAFSALTALPLLLFALWTRRRVTASMLPANTAAPSE